jgi:YggT family protein
MYFVYRLVDLAFEVYIWLIIIRALLSWIPISSTKIWHSLYKFVYEVTEPLLRLLRRLILPLGTGGLALDVSPFFAILLLEVLRRLVLTLIGFIF